MKIKKFKIAANQLDKLWFTSDTHFGHTNILKYCRSTRGYFKNIHQHDEYLLNQWNANVGTNDLIFHLGDLAFMDPIPLAELLSKLNGEIHFLTGNHDKNVKGPVLTQIEKCWGDRLELVIEDPEIGDDEFKQYIVLDHFPIGSWHHKYHGAWHLHGHCIDEATEILTEEGWKPLKLCRPGEGLPTYNAKDGVVEQDSIKDLVVREHTGKVFTFSGKSVDFRVTDGHTIVGYTRTGKWQEFPARMLEGLDRFAFVRAGVRASYPGIGLPESLLRLYVYMAADGSCKEETDLWRIRVKKPHKIEAVRKALTEALVEFNEYSSEEYVSFNFYRPDELKEWNVKGLDRKLSLATPEEFQWVLEAYGESDGSRNGDGFLIYTSKQKEADLLSELAIQRGYGCTVGAREGHGFSSRTAFQLSVYEAWTTMSPNLRDRVQVEEVRAETFRCVVTRNGNFFSRRNGKVHLTGNCHGTFPTPREMARLDVGVDVHNLAPISYNDIKAHMTSKALKTGVEPPEFENE